MSVKGEANGDQSPKGGKPFGDGHEVGVGRVALNDRSIKVNGSAGAEGIEFGGLGRQGRGEKCRYQQADNPVRQLLQDEGYKNVISVGGGRTWIDRRQRLGSLLADLFTHSMGGQSVGEGGAGRRKITVVPGFQPIFKLAALPGGGRIEVPFIGLQLRIRAMVRKILA